MLCDVVKGIVATLANGEHALTLNDFVQSTGFSSKAIGEALDFLVAIRIFECTSFGHEPFDPVVYHFADNSNAQELHNSFIEGESK